jgi:hypothetical protein
VVEVVVGDQHEFQVLDTHAGCLQPLLEGGECFVAIRPGVDQRQRFPPQQPRVDRADVGQRHLDLDDVIHASPGSPWTGRPG